MRKVLVTTIAALTTAMLFTVASANAATYRFTFQSNDSALTATGEFSVNAENEVTGVSGAVSGLTNQTISGVAANPGYPGASYSPDGSFIFDNVYYPTGPAFDVNGLLFVTTENPTFRAPLTNEFESPLLPLILNPKVSPAVTEIAVVPA